ncbi:MAG: NAD(P)H-dependent oxidoreductase subunit E [Clostridiales bacterium]|nr:NAD(P)H-dependent oxidoreductase subunit E [Clostridiales bacterium]
MTEIENRAKASAAVPQPDTVRMMEMQALLDRYPPDPRFALAVMQDMQRQFNYVPREGLLALSSRIGRSEAQLYSMATFYKALSIKPKGRHIIKLCDGTACHIRGSAHLVAAVERLLGIKPEETTTDGMFSLELVNCLGSCALAPVMVVDGRYYGKVSADQLRGILDECRAGEEERAAL